MPSLAFLSVGVYMHQSDSLSLLAVDQNGLSEVNKIGVPFVWLCPGQDLSCDEDRCLCPSEDGVRLPTWRVNLKAVAHAILSPYAVYLYMYRCGCTYRVTLKVFS